MLFWREGSRREWGRQCILVDWFLLCLSFQKRLVSMTCLNCARLNKLSYSQLQDWHKRCFPPFLLPQQSHTLAGKWPLWQNADGWLAVYSANTRLAFQKIEGILIKLVNPHKNTDKFVLHLFHIKKAFRMTKQADEWNVNMLVGYFGPAFAVFLILQLSGAKFFQQQGRQNNVYDGIIELVTQHMQLINLNFWCWCVTAWESTLLQFCLSSWGAAAFTPIRENSSGSTRSINDLGQQCICSSSVLHLYMYFININSCKLHMEFREKRTS